MASGAAVRATAIVLAFYGAAILVATLLPNTLDTPLSDSIDDALVGLHERGLPWWIGYNAVEFAANIAMFAPLGFLAGFLLPRRLWWLALAACIALSVLIEVTQKLLLSSRFATWHDVLANSAGAAAGVAIAVIVRSLLLRRSELRRSTTRRGRE